MDSIIFMAPVIVLGICLIMAGLAYIDERPAKETPQSDSAASTPHH